MELPIPPAISQWLPVANQPETIYPAAAATIVLLALGLITSRFYLSSKPNPEKTVPTLPSRLSLHIDITNTILFITNLTAFFAKAEMTLARSKSRIIQFRLGPMKTYFLSGSTNLRAVFRAPPANVSSDAFFLMAQERIWDSTPEDLAKFKGDKSGRLAIRINNSDVVAGTKGVAGEKDGKEMMMMMEGKRYWAGMHEVLHRYLTRSSETHVLGVNYQRFFEERLAGAFPSSEEKVEGKEGKKVVQVGILDFLKKEMGIAATTAFNGRRILEMNPNLLDLLWDFEGIAARLVWGLPRWLNRGPVGKRDRFNAAVRRYLEEVMPEMERVRGEDRDWEPVFGSRFVRELVFWGMEAGLAPRTMAGCYMVLTIFGSNANTVPATAWCLMELIKSPSLLAAVRAEVAAAYETSPETGKKTINTQILLTLPLIQSIYAEVLRLHVSMLVTRQVVADPIEIGGFTLEKGAMLQATTEIDHYNENVWASEGHPASEFWAERHIKVVDGKREFALAGNTYDFFPYGGGVTICPGRHFAKQEIMMTVAMLVTDFDFEFVGWTHLDDGRPSDRPAQNDTRFAGGASVPPDRDMQVLMKRRE